MSDDSIPMTDKITVSKKLTTTFTVGNRERYVSIEITEAAFPDEDEVDFIERTSALAYRQLFYTAQEFEALIKENTK